MLSSEKQLSNEEVDSLFKGLQNTRHIDDVVMTIIRQSNLDIFTASVEKLHRMFANLKVKHEQLYKELMFSKGDEFPFSKQLESIMFRLEMSGILSLKNPTYHEYEVSKEIDQAVQEKLALFNTIEHEEIKGDAEVFRREMTTKENQSTLDTLNR